MTRFTLEWKISAHDDGKIVREFLKEKDISKASLTDIKFSGGNILVNGEEVTVRKKLTEGDELKVIFPEEKRSEGILKEFIPLNIVYEDPYVLVIQKPHGMNTIPSREHPTGSLANGLAYYYDEKGISSTIHIVTRLDRDTSGLVLVAKHRHIHYLFSKDQQLNRIERTYEAFASGVFQEKKGIIEKPIRRKEDSIIEREVHPDGQYAYTKYEVIKQYEMFAHLSLHLKTGRTHQIRVHMSYLGHPLIGDELYGGPIDLMTRQALHCKKVSFYHPVYHKLLSFECPLPDDMAYVLTTH